MMDAIIAVLSKNALVTALAVTGLMMFVSHLLSKYLTKGKLQSSAIAITLGLVVAYFAGVYTQGTKGVSDIAIFSGFALLCCVDIVQCCCCCCFFSFIAVVY